MNEKLIKIYNENMDSWTKHIITNLMNKEIVFRGNRYFFKGLFNHATSHWLPSVNADYVVFLEPIDCLNKSDELKQLLKIDRTIQFNLSYHQIKTEIKGL